MNEQIKQFKKISIIIILILWLIGGTVLFLNTVSTLFVYKLISYGTFFIFLLISFMCLFFSYIFIEIYKKNKIMLFSPNFIRKSIIFSYKICAIPVTLLHNSKKDIRKFFIQINDIAILNMNIKLPSEKILVLLPHCIQYSKCNVKVTNNPKNCMHCGKCKVDKLVGLIEKYNVNLAIATGGTLARKKILEFKPKFIIAVACERDLISGIFDTSKIPVYGILNIIKNEPCVDTSVDVEKIEEILRKTTIKNVGV